MTSLDAISKMSEEDLDKLWRKVVRGEIAWNSNSTYWGANADDFFMEVEGVRRERGLWIRKEDDPENESYEATCRQEYKAALEYAKKIFHVEEPTWDELQSARRALGFPLRETRILS